MKSESKTIKMVKYIAYVLLYFTTRIECSMMVKFLVVFFSLKKFYCLIILKCVEHYQT